MDTRDSFVLWLLVGLIAIIGSLVVMEASDKIELGQAICEEEYGMNYKSYTTKAGLQCKDVIVKDDYDGLKVSLTTGGVGG